MPSLVRGNRLRAPAALISVSVLGGAIALSPAGAQDLAAFKGKWVNTNSPTKPGQPGIGAWIKIEAENPVRVYLSWGAPAVMADAQGQHGANIVWRSEVASCWYEMQRTGTKLTLRLAKGDPPGVCLEDSVFERPASAPKPEQAFSPTRAPAPLTAAEQRTLRPKDTFRECPECPEMVVVPAGSFTMGSPSNEEGRDSGTSGSGEGPQRRVAMARPFAVGKFEVTFAEWDACVTEGECQHNPGDHGGGRGRRPVINVSWNDITGEYLPWLSRKTGKSYRLPSEAEWEYAARASSTTRYHFGDNDRDLCSYGNVADLTFKDKHENWTLMIANCRDGYVSTAPVGSFRPNNYGLHDMHGNVQEWVQDCYHSTYIGAPTDGSAWTEVCGSGGRQAPRGGGYSTSPWRVRSAYRPSWYGYGPSNRDSATGFRVRRTLTP